MNTSDGKTRELWGRKFKLVKNGLDETEVFSFIGGLIDQNNALASKLEHLDSLTKLAERTVIEANKEAHSIETEAEGKANASAASIIAKAEEKARKEIERIVSEAELKAKQSAQARIAVAEQQSEEMLKAAEEKTESIKTNANDEATRIIAEAREKARENVIATEQQAQEMLKAAEGRAESIKANAEKKANQILAEAKEKAEDLANTRTASAEKEAQSMLEAARAKAEEEARLIKQKAEQLVRRSRSIAEDEIKDKLKRVYQGLLSSLEEINEDSIILPAAERKESEPTKSEPVVYVKEETENKEAQKQISLSEEKLEGKEIPNVYDGNVELVIPPPLGLDRMLQLHKHLRNIPNIEVMNLGISADKSITIRISLEDPTPLRKLLEDLPEVETTEDVPQDTEMTPSPKKAGERAPVKRIIVNTKK